MNFRQVHLDFHTSEKIPGIGSAFSKKQFQEMLIKGHVDSITVFSKCHHGWAYHPTKANEMHPELSFDLLGAQIEAAHEIGVAAPIRESGDVAGSGACKLVGPNGEVEIAEGVIAAKRHIHLTPAAAEEFGVADKQIVKVKCNGARPLIFDDVVVRVHANFAPAMHIDTDESNAAFGVTEGEIIVD